MLQVTSAKTGTWSLSMWKPTHQAIHSADLQVWADTSLGYVLQDVVNNPCLTAVSSIAKAHECFHVYGHKQLALKITLHRCSPVFPGLAISANVSVCLSSSLSCSFGNGLAPNVSAMHIKRLIVWEICGHKLIASLSSSEYFGCLADENAPNSTKVDWNSKPDVLLSDCRHSVVAMKSLPDPIKLQAMLNICSKNHSVNDAIVEYVAKIYNSRCKGIDA